MIEKIYINTSMAVKPEQIKARLRAIFPKANLSTVRLDAIAAKLSQKPADDADDTAIDEVLTAYNDDAPMTFEELARYDDKIRTLEAKTKGNAGNEGGTGGTPPAGNSTAGAGEDKLTDEEKRIAAIVAAATKPLADKLAEMESRRNTETITERFKKDERLKGVPEFMLNRAVPKSEDDYEASVTALATDYTEFAKQNKLANFGNDAPPAGTGTPNGKTASKAELEAVGL